MLKYIVCMWFKLSLPVPPTGSKTRSKSEILFVKTFVKKGTERDFTCRFGSSDFDRNWDTKGLRRNQTNLNTMTMIVLERGGGGGGGGGTFLRSKLIQARRICLYIIPARSHDTN